VTSQYRNFRTSPAPKQATPTSDPPSKREEDAGDKSRSRDRPTTSKWRRRQALHAPSGINDSYMIVDPATGSAEILDRNGRGRDKKQPKRLPPLHLPSWFDDCVTWPETAEDAFAKKQVVFLPSKDRNVTGMSFLSGTEDPNQQIIEGADKRIWLDPLLFTEIDGVIRTSLELPAANEKDTPLSLRSTVSLHCPLEGGMPLLNDIVEHIAETQNAGILRLSAQDLAELGGSYVCPDVGLNASLQTLPFDAYSEAVEEEAEGPEVFDENEAAEEEEDRPKPPSRMQNMGVVITPAFLPMQGASIGDMLKKITGAFGSPGGPNANSKRTSKTNEKAEEEIDTELLMNEERLDKFLNAIIDGAWSRHPDDVKEVEGPLGHTPRKLIVCIEDLIRVSQTGIGIELVEKLAEIIRRRRAEHGEKIALVGLSIDNDLLSSPEAEKTIQWETDHSIWRTFIVMPHMADGKVVTSDDPSMRPAIAQRHMQINIRNWYTIAAQMAPSLVPDRKNILEALNNEVGGALGFAKSVFPRDEIQRLATASIARALTQKREKLGLDDLVSATNDCRIIDTLRHNRLRSLRASEAAKEPKEGTDSLVALLSGLTGSKTPGLFDAQDTGNAGTSAMSARLQTLQQEADRYEKRLINGVVLPEKINTTFSDVHVAKSTVEAVRDLTALSLQRPDAFKYGVLATNSLSGLLLYGPPGTGKTMLAKAVAKESEAAVLTVTGSDVNQMWVGESEKTVKAIFTLARKLAPCVVFIDEADALLASRGSDSRGGRPNHRDTINQFLLEWDGMNESGVFLMVATNRPFDLDDAVLRRLPRRVLVDLPTKDDREAILRIHTKDESLSSEVDIANLAEHTPYYSGSDLKNLVVSAALTAVKDELMAKKKAESNGTEYSFPEKRVLTKAHFEKAMGEIGASVSGDMSSLRQIKKFDEQYGDRKGRRKKNPYGFFKVEERESDARVRA
jgi:SpoVK/Ycf46/Vps4 family AAA+-type ATPase